MVFQEKFSGLMALSAFSCLLELKVAHKWSRLHLLLWERTYQIIVWILKSLYKNVRLNMELFFFYCTQFIAVGGFVFVCLILPGLIPSLIKTMEFNSILN